MLSALSFPRECVVLITNNSFKLAYIKYISKVVHPKYWRGFYKYLLCLKKNSGELLWSAHCTWHQNALLSLPCDMDAMTGRICSYPDGELVQMLTGCGNTHLWVQGGYWEQGGWDTHDARRVEVGNPYHSTSSCHWILDKTQGTSLRENSSSHEQQRVGKWGQTRAGDHAICHLLCSLMFSKMQCYYAGLCVCVLQYT